MGVTVAEGHVVGWGPAPHPPAGADRGRATGLDPSFGPPQTGRRDHAATSPFPL